MVDALEFIHVYGLPVTALVAVVAGGWLGVYVWGWTYRELRAERNYYRRLALTGTVGMKEAMTIAEALGRQDAATQHNPTALPEMP